MPLLQSKGLFGPTNMFTVVGSTFIATVVYCRVRSSEKVED
jgi:hypothetical protein